LEHLGEGRKLEVKLGKPTNSKAEKKDIDFGGKREVEVNFKPRTEREG